MEVRMAKVMSKSELIQKIAEQHSNKNMARKDVKAVIELLAAIGYKELNKSGAFLVPGLPNSLSSRSQQQRSAAASIRSQRNQQYLRRSLLGRSSRLGR
jgi:nucleoid DNA-binding protein